MAFTRMYEGLEEFEPAFAVLVMLSYKAGGSC